MPLQKSYFFWKRVFDVFFSLALMSVLFPVVVVFFLAVAWETRTFPFYIQDRGVFLEGKRFRIYKFRTMRERITRQPHSGAAKIFSKPEYAEYVPRFCGWLRLTGLDELPQLWNILKGEMSFIGPRPLAIGDLEAMKLESPSLYNLRASLTSPAGLSGLWQLFGSREEGVENLVSLDLLYERHRSITLDLSLILRTIPTVLLALRADAIVKKSGVGFEETGGRRQETEDRRQKLEFRITKLEFRS